MSSEAETGVPSNTEVLTADRTGSDFMVDVIKSLGFEYVCANPGSSFRAIHESIINYGGNKSPEFITCCHEESAVGMAHGYAKVEGKPLAVLAHGTVGVQHAAMAIYNAYCDRVPVYLILGNIIDETKRVPGVEWAHSVQDAAAMVRDFTKWDDLPISLTHFAESAVRAYKIAMTPPTLPVVIVADGELQENPISADAKMHIPKLTLAAPPTGRYRSGHRSGAAAGCGGDSRNSR
jgi:acetolactate synthase-1/2/3 large subunit